MTSRSKTPSAPAKRATAAQGDGPGDKLDTVLDELKALRQDFRELRDELRTVGQRRTPRRERSNRDPGDAVPPGVAVQDPAPLSTGERKARHNLERLSRD